MSVDIVDMKLFTEHASNDEISKFYLKLLSSVKNVQIGDFVNFCGPLRIYELKGFEIIDCLDLEVAVISKKNNNNHRERFLSSCSAPTSLDSR